MYKILGADQKEYGPVTAEQVQQWIAERRLNGQSMARLEGTEGWKPLAQFPEFSASFAGLQAAPVTIAPLSTYKPPPPTNNMAITSLIMGCVSMVCCPVLGVLGIVFSAMALSQLKSEPLQGGKGLAITGLVLSLLSFAWFGLLIALGAFSNVIQQMSR